MERDEVAKLVQMSKRPMGVIQIHWDPNSGGLQVHVEGITQIEEAGLYQFVSHMRMNANKVGLDLPRVQPVGLVKPS